MSSDYQLEDTVFLPFTTRAFATGIPTALAGTPAIDIYEDATVTPIITGETLVVSLNSVVGFNMITVTATAASGFEAGKSYTAIIQAGTVGGVSVVGEVVSHFTLDMSAAAKDLANGTDGLTALKTGIDDIPTVAEFNARTLLAASYFDPTADAVANVTLCATTTALTNVINAASIVASVSGNVDGSVDSVTGDTKQTADHTAAIADIPTVAEFNARTLLAASYFDPTADAVANVTLCATTTTLTNVINAASIVASVSGNVDGSVDSVTGDTKQTADHTAGIADIPTVAEFNARTLLSASYFDPAADTVVNVTNVTAEVSADISKINGVTITGDGSGTPFDV